MACLLSTAAILFVLAAVLVAAASRASPTPWNGVFRHVAQRFRGVYHPGGWFQGPSVWLRHGEAHGRLILFKIPGGGTEQCLQVTVLQTACRSRCEIFRSDTRPSILPSRQGLAPLQYDWDEFGRRWHVWAANGDEAKELLADGVRLAIEMLGRQPNFGLKNEISISLAPGWLMVRKLCLAPVALEAEEFVERAIALADQLNLAAAAGVGFVETDEAQVLDDACCGVCGDPLTGNIVVCRRCNAPHHLDCWQYIGGCATYACGGRECVAPSVARLADAQGDLKALPPNRPMKPR